MGTEEASTWPTLTANMDKPRFAKDIGYRFRLVPEALTVQGEAVRDDWILNRVDLKEGYFELQRVGGGGHSRKFGLDYVYSFYSDPERDSGGVKYGFLILHGQVRIDGARVDFEPAPAPRMPLLSARGRPRKRQDSKGDAVLVESWQMLGRAIEATELIYAAYRESPPLDQMSTAEIEGFLADPVASFLSLLQKEGIRHSSRKREQFVELQRWYEFVEANNSTIALRKYMKRQSVLLPDEIAEDILGCVPLLHSAIVDWQIWREMGQSGSPEPSIRKEGQATLQKVRLKEKEIERKIRAHLKRTR